MLVSIQLVFYFTFHLNPIHSASRFFVVRRYQIGRDDYAVKSFKKWFRVDFRLR
jgi:hypothetical protein